ALGGDVMGQGLQEGHARDGVHRDLRGAAHAVRLRVAEELRPGAQAARVRLERRPPQVDSSRVREIGRVVRLQVQTAALKRGARPDRVYDPAPLAQVPRLRLSPRGAAGIRDGGPLLDVHHGDHPSTKWEAGREASFGFTSHYGRMRGEYGGHLADGCAG